jgi:hypothetical protein
MHARYSALKPHETESALDIFEKFYCLTRGGPVGRRQTSERGVDLRQTMRSTRSDLRIALPVKAEAELVMRVFGKKHRHEHRRIEK